MTSRMARALAAAALLTLLGAWHCGPAAADDKPILIGVNAPIQLQVGRDTVDGVKMAIDEINAGGGVLGRKLAMVVADEGVISSEGAKTGIAAVNKLTGEDHVDLLIGGYDSGLALAELPHISRAKTIYLGVGAAAPGITAKVKEDYEHYKYIFRVGPLNSIRTSAGLLDFIKDDLKGELGYNKIAIIGENAKFVQDMIPYLKKGAEAAGLAVTLAEFFDEQTSDFSPLFAKVKASGAQYLFVIISHAASDVFIKQWYDAKLPLPVGGLDVKSMDADFFTRVDGKAVSEVTTNFVLRAPISPKTISWWDRFEALYHRSPVYTAPAAYDAVYIYVEALTHADASTTDDLVKALEKSEYVGVRGRVAFDATHDVRDGPGLVNQIFVQWQPDGSRVVVWPKALATGKMIMPPWLPQK